MCRKSFDTTNLIILDADGSRVSETLLTVVAPEDNLIVQRGMERESYSCKPDCLPAIALGDDKAFMAGAIQAMRDHDASTSVTR